MHRLCQLLGPPDQSRRGSCRDNHESLFRVVINTTTSLYLHDQIVPPNKSSDPGTVSLCMFSSSKDPFLLVHVVRTHELGSKPSQSKGTTKVRGSGGCRLLWMLECGWCFTLQWNLLRNRRRSECYLVAASDARVLQLEQYRPNVYPDVLMRGTDVLHCHSTSYLL